MKIGVMGLGTIAQKAYLPLMGSMQDIQWVMHTRNNETLNQIQKQYNFEEAYDNFDDFINSGITACFVHTPTNTHAKYIRKLLELGIHVYVDKPISESLEETEALIQFAKNQNRVLFCGFNRRYAPLTQRLKKIKNKNMIVVQKHRPDANQEVRFALYDMMIHCVDTALYLLDEPIEDIQTKLIHKEGILHRAILNIESKNTSVIVAMNMKSGARPETFEVMSQQGYDTVKDLNIYLHEDAELVTKEHFPDWTPVLERRGFVNAINAFLECIEKGEALDNSATLLSHQIIESFLKNEKSQSR